DWSAKKPENQVDVKCSVLEHSLKTPLYHICLSSVLLKVLAVFTPFEKAEVSDVIEAHKITQATVTSIEAGRRPAALKEAYSVYDDLQLQWDNQSLCNKNGFLTKRGGSVKSWKIRWFTLRGYELKYFDEPVDEKALTTLDLRFCRSVVDDQETKPNCFGLTFPERTYYMYAISPTEKAEWMSLVSWKLFMQAPPAERARLALAVPASNLTNCAIDLIKTSL
uniref:PH domain-containing protein n=1 Tax=Ciona savignyi TaxID=51511 RepID=H2Y7N5_CIOSA